MKRLLAFAVAAVVLIGTAAVYAGGSGCCMSGKKGATSGGSCSEMFSKLNLTDAQKAKLDALKDECKRATSTSEAHAAFSAGLEKILTPEQLAQFKAQCDAAKAKAGGECPYSKGMKKS
jgi:Spy/CpxP family protein refolding chaperone